LGFVPFIISFLVLLVFGTNSVKIQLDINLVPYMVKIIITNPLKKFIKSNLLTLFSILTGFLFNAIVLLLTLKSHKNKKMKKIWEVLLVSILYLISISLFILILLVFDIYDFLAIFLISHFFFCFFNTLRHFYIYVLLNSGEECENDK
jgi:fatty acid desaturase